MTTTPLAERTRIVLVGLRNAGKSSLMNRLFQREVSIISHMPGTTTDPVTRSMELGSLGPVAVTDTAGLDDEGQLGAERVKRSAQRAAAADLLLFVTPGHQPPTAQEQELLQRLKGKSAALLFVRTFGDQRQDQKKLEWTSPAPSVTVNNRDGRGMQRLLELLQESKEQVMVEKSPLHGLAEQGDLFLLVTPIDSAAPKGRLILPQVETLRDALDRGCATLVSKEDELPTFYRQLKERPKLIITDSQAFHQVAAAVPADQPLTSFSILFARKKWDISELLRGLRRLADFPAGGRVLVMESCSHHRQEDDIGTVKIPRLFRRHVDPQAEFEFARSLPEEEELRRFSLVIHCAGCMTTRGAAEARTAAITRLGIPVTNYGLFLAWCNGLMPRAIEPLPEAEALLEALEPA